MIYNDFAKLLIPCHKVLLSKLVQIASDVNTVTWTETWSTSYEFRVVTASSNTKQRDEAYSQILPGSEVLGAWILWQGTTEVNLEDWLKKLDGNCWFRRKCKRSMRKESKYYWMGTVHAGQDGSMQIVHHAGLQQAQGGNGHLGAWQSNEPNNSFPAWVRTDDSSGQQLVLEEGRKLKACKKRSLPWLQPHWIKPLSHLWAEWSHFLHIPREERVYSIPLPQAAEKSLGNIFQDERTNTSATSWPPPEQSYPLQQWLCQEEGFSDPPEFVPLPDSSLWRRLGFAFPVAVVLLGTQAPVFTAQFESGMALLKSARIPVCWWGSEQPQAHCDQALKLPIQLIHVQSDQLWTPDPPTFALW